MGLPPHTVSSRRFLDDLAMSSSGMVNTGFRLPFHGFELVDAWGRNITGTGVNRKFTTPPFRKIFA